MRHKKKLKNVFAISLLLSISFFIVGCSNVQKSISSSNLKKLPISQVEGSFVINTDNPKEVVGYADYVFLGRVDQLVGTDYKDPVTVETAKGTKTLSSPYTNYKVTVLKNIKGSLQTDTPIPVQKEGGVNKDLSSVILYENDNLPEVKKVYVFIAFTQPDGTLLVSGPNSNILVGKSDKTETSANLPTVLKKSEVVSSYENATANQVKKDRKRFVSKFDLNK